MRAEEFIKEIIIIHGRLEPMEKYVNYFNNLERFPAFENFTLSENKIEDSHYFGLFNKDDVLISILHIADRDLPYYQVTYSQTSPEYQGLGCFRYLLDYAVNLYGNILSDTHQTIDAASAWKALSRYPSGKVHYYVYDMYDGSTKKITYSNYDEIWHNNENPVLLATKTINPPKLQEHIDRDNTIKKKYGRDHDSLFYGIKSSSHDYINP